MIRQLMISAVSTLCMLTATAATPAGMYLIGPGATCGYTPEHAVPMHSIGADVWETTCYLKNVNSDTDGWRSFRLQTERAWTDADQYYSPAEGASALDEGKAAGMKTGSDADYFLVPYDGLWHIKADLSEGAMNITISRPEQIHLVGNVAENGENPWEIHQLNASLHLKEGYRSMTYTGDLTLTEGEFKIMLDRDQNRWDPTLQVYRGENFNTTRHAQWDDEGKEIDGKWTVGTGEDADLKPQRYRITYDAVAQTIRFENSIWFEGCGISGLEPVDTDRIPAGFSKRGVMIEGTGPLVIDVNGRRSEPVYLMEPGRYTLVVQHENMDLPTLQALGPIHVNMPLKEEDFADGQKHYFLVGARTAAWRLQPEWELTPDADGTFSMTDRLLYNGYYMVACVDNYEDYVTQHYRGYSDVNREIVSVLDPRQSSTEFSLSELPSILDNGRYSCVFYGNEVQTSPSTQHTGDYDNYDGIKTRVIDVLSAEGWSGLDSTAELDCLQSSPSRAGKITLTVDADGNPSKISFTGMNTYPEAIAEIRTFSLCGDQIQNVDVPYVKGVSVTPINNFPGADGKSRTWADAWIQYDSSAHPYVDANGEYLYQTLFTEEWLRAHPSYFKTEDGLTFTSTSILFVHEPEITHADQFGRFDYTDEYNYSYRSRLHTYSDGVANASNARADNNLDDMITVSAEKRACFVVNDMWMKGLFKVWSGWSGAATNHEYNNNGTAWTRWYRDNASHNIKETNQVAYYQASGDMAFTLFEDVNAANFGIGYGIPTTADNSNVDANGRITDASRCESKFFNKVEIWYNLENGFRYTADEAGNASASFLVFYQQNGTPAISAQKRDAVHGQYTFDLPLVDGLPDETEQEEYGNVTYYKIERIKITDGVEEDPVTVAEETVDTPRATFGDMAVADPTPLWDGDYRYRITTRRANTADRPYVSKSNIFTITPEDVEEVIATGVDAPEVTETKPVRVEIYTIGGTLVSVQTSADGTPDLNALQRGLYIVRIGGKTLKIMK